MRYDINPPTPAGISLAAGEYRTRSVYRKSTQWIYIAQKQKDGLCRPFVFDPWGNRTPVTAVKGRCLSRLTNGPYYGTAFRQVPW